VKSAALQSLYRHIGIASYAALGNVPRLPTV